MEVKHLVWDSNFFGLKIGKIESPPSKIPITAFLKKAVSNQYDLIYLFCSEDTTISKNDLNQFQGKKVDTKFSFSWNSNNNKNLTTISNDIVEYQEKAVSINLKNLALQSGLHSRFKIDSNFKPSKFEQLYTEWISNSVSKKFADFVFVKKEAHREVGFVTLKINYTTQIGTIGLIAVDPKFRGKQIGQQLLDTIKQTTTNLGIEKIHVATQKENNGACNFYLKNNFTLYSCTQIYHFWLKNI